MEQKDEESGSESGLRQNTEGSLCCAYSFLIPLHILWNVQDIFSHGKTPGEPSRKNSLKKQGKKKKGILQSVNNASLWMAGIQVTCFCFSLILYIFQVLLNEHRLHSQQNPRFLAFSLMCPLHPPTPLS